VKNDVGFAVSQIRPHELLNYFSFDTVTPDADQVFDVLASAEERGDTLEVALSVRGATPPPEPLDLTLVVDRSCSMEAEGRMEYTKRGLRQMTDQLQRGDRVDVVLFDDTKCVPLENYVVGRDDPALLSETIDRMQAEGGTDLDLGLREGYRVAKSHRDTRHRNRRMMLLTDAMLNTGDVNHDTVSEIGKAYEADGIRLTGVGVGRDFNDDVLDKLTEKGKGAYVYLGSEAVVDRVFGVGFPSLVQTIAHDVRFELELPDSLAMERFYGEEASTVAADIQPIHYYAGTSQVFLQDLTHRDMKPSDRVQLTVRYTDAQTGEPAKRVFRTTVGDMLDADPHNVRKAKALMAWTDLLTEQAMGGDACGAPLRAYAERAARVSDDAEIGYVNGLIRRRCGDFELPAAVAQAKAVPYKVKVDADIPIAEVALSCNGRAHTEALSGADTVARFEATPGACELTLSGTVDMTASVEVPTTGGDLRCIVRGGRLSCS
jgi:Ca-activated chloride channel family protein